MGDTPTTWQRRGRTRQSNRGEARRGERGERRKHDDEWEEPLLKRNKHLKKMTMRAEAARAGKRFKHAVTALSVMSYEPGQKHFYRTLAAMTD
jgi:hypothetical protein